MQGGWEQFYGDHLHMRGEYPKIEALVAIPPGSPPHAWRIQRLLTVTALVGSFGSLVLTITSKFTKKALIRKKTFTLRLVKRLN